MKRKMDIRDASRRIALQCIYMQKHKSISNIQIINNGNIKELKKMVDIAWLEISKSILLKSKINK